MPRRWGGRRAAAGLGRQRDARRWGRVAGDGRALPAGSGPHARRWDLRQRRVALSPVPAAVAGLLAGSPRLPVRAGAGVGAAVAGTVWCHPSAAASIAVTTAAWWAGMLVTPAGPHRAAPRRPGSSPSPPGSRRCCSSPRWGPVLGQSARTANWPPDTGPVPLTRALGETLGFPYSGGPTRTRPDPRYGCCCWSSSGSVWLSRCGADSGRSLPSRCGARSSSVRGGSPGTGIDALVTRFVDHAMLRTWSHVYLLAPVLAGLGGCWSPAGCRARPPP